MTKSLTQTLKQKKAKKGFTLIELIVVIAIIGVLAAMLVPSMVGYVNESKTAKNDANARTIYSAAQAAFASFIDDDTLTETMDSTSTHDYIVKVNTLVGDLKGSYSIVVKAGEGVEKVVYSTTSTPPGIAAPESTNEIGMYPAASESTTK